MQKKFKFLWPVCTSLLCAALSLLLAATLIRSLSGPVGWIGSLAGMSGSDVAYAAQVVGQLANAEIASPWLPFLLVGAIFGLLTAWLLRRRTHKIAVGVCLHVLLLILLTPAALWLTEVNAVQVGALLKILIPLLPALL